MYKGLFTAQVDLATSPMSQAVSTSKEIVSLSEEISRLDLTNAAAIRALREKVQACLHDVDLWRLRNDLVADAVKLKNDEIIRGSVCANPKDMDIEIANEFAQDVRRRSLSARMGQWCARPCQRQEVWHIGQRSHIQA